MSDKTTTVEAPFEPTREMIIAGMDALSGYSPSEKWGPSDRELKDRVLWIWEAMMTAYQERQP